LARSAENLAATLGGGGELTSLFLATRRSRRFSLRTLSTLLFVLTAFTGCANPLWRFDKFHVVGTLEGTTCRVKLDSTDLTSENGGTISLMRTTQKTAVDSPPRSRLF
jgi:hypothetical protein